MGAEAADWLREMEGRINGVGSWQGVQNHSLDMCEITLTVKLYGQNKQWGEETVTCSEQ